MGERGRLGAPSKAKERKEGRDPREIRGKHKCEVQWISVGQGKIEGRGERGGKLTTLRAEDPKEGGVKKGRLERTRDGRGKPKCEVQ